MGVFIPVGITVMNDVVTAYGQILKKIVMKEDSQETPIMDMAHWNMPMAENTVVSSLTIYRHGEGELLYTDKPDMSDNLIMVKNKGRGFFTIPDSSRYEGEFKGGKRSGDWKTFLRRRFLV